MNTIQLYCTALILLNNKQVRQERRQHALGNGLVLVATDHHRHHLAHPLDGFVKERVVRKQKLP